MEKSFIVSKESEYRRDFDKYIEMVNEQKKFINKFFDEKGIKGVQYKMWGNGSYDVPFNEEENSEIKLGIIPTEEDSATYSKSLTKPNKYHLCYFKKSSKMAKEFAKRCINEKIIINIYKPRVSDYFKSLGGFRGYSSQQFEYEDKLYLKVESDYLGEDDNPKGFEEIKLSEYYLARENTKKIE